jgi:pimeloyl-ACP methyl ester carboxylesterase
VSNHTGELDGLPVFWRSAPPSGEDGDRAPALYLHGVPTSSDDWVGFPERYVTRPWRLILGLAKVGLAWDVVRVTPEKARAKLATQASPFLSADN